MLPEMTSESAAPVDDTYGQSLSYDMTSSSSKKHKKSSGLQTECPNDDTVSLNLSGCLATQWIKERGSVDDKSFIKCLLDMYTSYKQGQLYYHVVDKMPIVDTECSVGISLSDKACSSVLKSEKSLVQIKEGTEEGAALVKVEVDQSHLSASNEENWNEGSLEHLDDSIEERNLESDLVEILVNKSEDTRCEICRLKVVGETKRHHVFSEHFSLYVKCKLCESASDVSNESEVNLIGVDEYFSHQSAAHNDLSRVCPFCKQVMEVTALSRHLINRHWKQLFCLCNACGVNSSAPLCLLKGISVGGHLLKKHSTPNLEKVTCEICGVVVLQLNLAKHIKSVHEGAREICELCGKSFNDVRRHKKRVHVEARDKYQCTKCDKKLTSKWNLTVHNRLHTGEKPFTCEVCGKSFHQKVELKLHARNNHENPRKGQNNRKMKASKTLTLSKILGGTASQRSKSTPAVPVPLTHKNVLQATISPGDLSSSSNMYTIIPSQPSSNTLLATTSNIDSNLGNVTVINVCNKDLSEPRLVWIAQPPSGDNVSIEALT